MTVICAPCEIGMQLLAESSVDAIVTDPPYELGFMGKSWDSTGIAYSVPMWREALRVLKPGGHLLAFSATRTYHRMVCAIEDAGFEIRDQIGWAYGTGFPKSLDVSKAIDKASGAEREVIGVSQWAGVRGATRQSEYGFAGGDAATVTAPATEAARQWQGWGTALKPAWEPIVVARKPIIGTVAANVLAHGTGGLNIDGCRIETADNLNGRAYAKTSDKNAADASSFAMGATAGEFVQPTGRWPANLLHDGSDEVLALFPDTGKSTGGGKKNGDKFGGGYAPPGKDSIGFGDTGSAARFFYCAKASKADRGEGNKHETVKPTDLMRYLCRLVTPPGGMVLDPFTGSGSTGKAAILEGFRFVGFEKDPEHAETARRRMQP